MSKGLILQHSQNRRPCFAEKLSFFCFTNAFFRSRSKCATSFFFPSVMLSAGRESASASPNRRACSTSSGLAISGRSPFFASNALKTVSADFSSATVLVPEASKVRCASTSLPSVSPCLASDSKVSNLFCTSIGEKKCRGFSDKGRTRKIVSVGCDSIDSSIVPMAHFPSVKLGAVILSRSRVGLGTASIADTRFGMDRCVRSLGAVRRRRLLPPFLARKPSVDIIQSAPLMPTQIAIGLSSNAESTGLYSNSPRPPLGRQVM